LWMIKIVNKAATSTDQPIILDPHMLFPRKFPALKSGFAAEFHARRI
jgi:hypothetical protein